MKNISTTSIIISSIIISMVLLAWVERQQQDQTHHKSWWVVSFANPLPEMPAAALHIENYTADPLFDVTIQYSDIIHHDEYTIPRGETKNIPLPQSTKKITVHVKHGDQTRTLYKK